MGAGGETVGQGGVTVRSPGPGEVDAAVDIWRASDTARRGGQPPTPEAMARDWMVAPDAILLVAERDGRSVGMTLAVGGRRLDDGPPTPAGPTIPGLCHVSLVLVAPDAWGRRIGARLLDAVLAEATVRGYDRVHLFTRVANERGRRLYASRGFRATGDTAVNPAGEEIMRFARSLSDG